MTTTITPSLTEQQIADYHGDGYIIVRNVLSVKEANELRRVVQQQVIRDAYPSTLKYPQPAKYTVSGNRLTDPGLTAIAEHPTVCWCCGIRAGATRASDCLRRLSPNTGR